MYCKILIEIKIKWIEIKLFNKYEAKFSFYEQFLTTRPNFL